MPETEQKQNYLLITSDGYSISTAKYDDYAGAYKAMLSNYDNLNNNEPDDEWNDMSYIDDMDALLYAGGEDVYVWKIVKI